MKKDLKLYNFIIPPFLIVLFSPFYLGASIIGNFIIDSAVLLLVSLIAYKRLNFRFYKKLILRVYLFGFAADIIGLIYLYLLVGIGSGCVTKAVEGSIAYKLFNGMSGIMHSYAGAGNPYTYAFLISAVVLVGAFIFLIDYQVFFNTEDFGKKQRLFSALIFAVLTAPYTLLLRSMVFSIS